MIKRSVKYLIPSFIYTSIIALVLAAILMSLARISLPIVEDYKDEIETWLSDYFEQQIDIASINAVWYGLEPQLVLRGVQLLSQDRMEVIGYFQDARLGLNLTASLIERRLVPGAFTLDGARFGIMRSETGEISVQGIAADAAGPNQSDKFLEDWIFNQRLLNVKNSEVIWTDHKLDRPPRLFNNVNLRFINVNGRHLIEGSVNLPEQIGSSIDLIVDAKGDLFSANGWQGMIYIETNGLEIEEILNDKIKEKYLVRNGALSTRIWTSWNAGELVQSQGDFSVNDISIEASKKNDLVHDIPLIKSNFLISKNSQTWNLALNNLVARYNGDLWRPSNAEIKYNAENKELALNVDYLKLGDLVSFFLASDLLDDSGIRTVKALNPKAIILNSVLTVRNQKFYVSGKLNNFSNISHKLIPGFRGVNAEFIATNNVAYLNFPKNNLTFSYPAVYEEDSYVEDFSARMLFEKNDSSWKLTIPNSNLKFKKTEAHGSLSLSSNPFMESPLLDLSFYLKKGSLSNAKYYIPANIMNKGAVGWIKDSLNEGGVTNATITHYGEVGKYPFKDLEGAFLVDIGVKKGVLQFNKAWPRITDIEGVFRLNSRSFNFFANSGESLGNDLEQVNITFPDFFTEKKKILIKGEIVGDSKDKLLYLHQSPLEDLFAKHIKPMGLQGNSSVDLSLDIPLADVKLTKVNGYLKLQDNQLGSEEWKLDLKDLSGEFKFTEKSFSADLIRAKFFDKPINGNISTIKEDNNNWLVIRGLGVFDESTIGESLKYYLDNESWSKFIQGQTGLSATLSIPFDLREVTGSKVKLQLGSNLKGMAVNLPDPFTKEADAVSNFAIDMDLTGASREISVLYGDYNALLQAKVTATSYVVERGSVGLQQTAVLPNEHGFRFSGRLPKFHWNEWEPLIIPKKKSEALIAEGRSGSLFFDVNIGDLKIFDNRFANVNLHASKTSHNWLLHATGPQLEGDINLPIDFSRLPVVLSLTKLHIKEELDEKVEIENNKIVIDPISFPELDIKIKDFRFKSMDIGQIELKTKRVNEGQEIESLIVKSNGSSVSATGNWLLKENKSQQTQIKARIKARQFGKTLDAWDFKDVLLGGNGNLDANLSWAGNPADFSFETIAGSLNIKLKDASLLDFDLGAAKLFTVMLPRRLLLDFRDVAQEGLYFDEIKGGYSIESGDAFTNKFQLLGPVTDITLAGKIGLASKSFDKVITVNRRLLGDSIPLVGTVITSVDPIIGGSLFVMKKLFENQIDDILSVQYTVEGAWDSPVISPVEKISTDEDGSDNELTNEILNE